MPTQKGFKQDQCAVIDGFGLHPAVRCGEVERRALEQPRLYITRQALAKARIRTSAAGQAVLRLKTPSHDGTTHLVLSPLEQVQRLAALVSRWRQPAPMDCSRYTRTRDCFAATHSAQ